MFKQKRGFRNAVLRSFFCINKKASRRRLVDPKSRKRLLHELRRQEEVLIFRREALRKKVVTEFALHVALARPFNAVGRAVFDGGRTAALFGGGLGLMIVFELQFAAQKVKGIDHFLNMLDGVRPWRTAFWHSMPPARRAGCRRWS